MPSLSNRQWFAVIRIVSIVCKVRLIRYFTAARYKQRFIFNLMNVNPKVTRPALSLAEVRRVVVGLSRKLEPIFSCLEIALATNFVVRQHGWAATVRIGISKDQPRVAHAWLEIDGCPVLGNDPRFQKLTAYGGRYV